MQDYNINVNYNNMGTNHAKTSPRGSRTNIRKTSVLKPEQGGRKKLYNMRRTGTVILAGASKINSYVGELTENTVTQKKRQIGIFAIGVSMVAITNPELSIATAGLMVGNAAIQYGIKQYKENLNAEFMRDLSGGVNTRR